jgi:hypothetical protein
MQAERTAADAVPELAQSPLVDPSSAWDPIAALSRATLIRDPVLKAASVSDVLREWALIDSRGALRFLERADDYTLEQATPALETLAWLAPEGVLALIARLDRRYAYRVVLPAAMQALTERDLEAGIARLGALPPGQDLDLARYGVAAGYAERDPDAALRWAQGLFPASPDTVSNVLTAVAAQDVERAFELAIGALSSGNSAGVDSTAWMTRWTAAADSATMARIGDRIAGLDSRSANALVSGFGAAWSGSDPPAALDWALAHGELGAQLFGNLAINYAANDIDAALESVERLPVEHQASWIETALFSFGFRITSAQDRDGVLSALARFEGHPSYERAVAGIARGFAMSPQRFNEPGSVTEFVESLPQGRLRREIEAAMANSPWQN